jgi:hypothetical protein
MKTPFLVLIILFVLCFAQKKPNRDACNSKYDTCKSLCKFGVRKSKSCLVDCYEEYKKCLNPS